MIILSNGKKYNTIVINSYKELIQGLQRDVLEFHFKSDENEDGYKLDEAMSLYKDTTPFNDIKIYEDIPNEEGDYQFLSEHLYFTLAVRFWAETIDEIPRYIIKVAKMSELELMQKEQNDILTALLTE